METAIAIHAQPTAEQVATWQALKNQFKPDGSHDLLKTSEPTYQDIQGAIQQRRDQFVSEYQEGIHSSLVMTYEPEFDRVGYRTLRKFARPTEAFENAKTQLDSFTSFQLETFIGERLNVGLSTYTTEVKNGQLWGKGMDESLVSMTDRGRNTRNALVDQKEKDGKLSPEKAREMRARHDAEVAGLVEIQRILGDLHTLPGTTMISVSPPGTGYAHNFYDVFTLQEHNGSRVVEVRRYTSALSPEDSLKKMAQLQSGYDKNADKADINAYFLSHPITISDPLHQLFNNPNGIHSYMHMEHAHMTKEDFALVREVCADIISVYLQEVYTNPENTERHAEILDALMNKADWAADNVALLREKKQPLRRTAVLGPVDIDMRQKAIAAAMSDIAHFGQQAVRVTTTGCGESGSFRKKVGSISGISFTAGAITMPGNMSSRGILGDLLSQVTNENDGFECPNCHMGRVKGPQCKQCGITAKQWAEEHPELACV